MLLFGWQYINMSREQEAFLNEKNELLQHQIVINEAQKDSLTLLTHSLTAQMEVINRQSDSLVSIVDMLKKERQLSLQQKKKIELVSTERDSILQRFIELRQKKYIVEEEIKIFNGVDRTR